jgi:hypothetical protein
MSRRLVLIAPGDLGLPRRDDALDIGEQQVQQLHAAVSALTP